MAVQAILNELSWTPSAGGPHEAYRRIRGLLGVLREAAKFGAERAIRVTEDFYAKELCAGVTVAQCFEAEALDQTERDFFKDIIGALQFIDSANEIGTHQEFICDEQSITGLGIAFLNDNLAVSFCSDSCWDKDFIQIKKIDLDDESGDLTELSVSVRHCSTVAHVAAHQNWLTAKRQLLPFSEAAAKNSIKCCLDNLAFSGFPALAQYDFGDDFTQSAKQHGFFLDSGLRHVLAETCARILTGTPKNDLNQWHTAELKADWLAFRTHLTKAGPGFRLMFWIRSDGLVIFANIGPKFEEGISYAIPKRLFL